MNPQNSRINNILVFDFGVWILVLTGNILERNTPVSLYKFVHLDHILSCWFVPRASGIFTSLSAKKKEKKRNHKLTNALEFKLCLLSDNCRRNSHFAMFYEWNAVFKSLSNVWDHTNEGERNLDSKINSKRSLLNIQINLRNFMVAVALK